MSILLRISSPDSHVFPQFLPPMRGEEPSKDYRAILMRHCEALHQIYQPLAIVIGARVFPFFFSILSFHFIITIEFQSPILISYSFASSQTTCGKWSRFLVSASCRHAQLFRHACVGLRACSASAAFVCDHRSIPPHDSRRPPPLMDHCPSHWKDCGCL